MGSKHVFTWFTFFVCIFPWVHTISSEENFLLRDGLTNEVQLEFGTHIHDRHSPCSTFKIALSLMGFDSSILKDEENPSWDFQEGYDVFLESWKASQTPQSWMKNSCVWYSQVLALHLGSEKIQNYLNLLDYGNKKLSGELSRAWINSSLKISPYEQVNFLQKMLQEEFPISISAVHMTKALLFKEELTYGWKLFGKTGWSGSLFDEEGKRYEIGWFVGWIENNQSFYPFAYNIIDERINLGERIPRVKELLLKSEVMKRRYCSLKWGFSQLIE